MRERRSFPWRWWPVALPACGLALAIGIQGAPIFRETPHPRAMHLERVVPVSVPGWLSHDTPLGANEFLTGEAEKILNYDEVVNREYVRGDATFGVYVAYWGAGKMPTRMVALHTPDRCWTGNGWRCLAMQFQKPEAFDGRVLRPAEWRKFDPPDGGEPVYVLYWHLVAGRLYDYGGHFNAVPDPWRWWRDAFDQALRGSQEQLFIRLTSNRPLETLWNDPGFAAVMRRLAELGLYDEDARKTPDHSQT